MPLSDEDYNHNSMYYGLYSARQAARVSELLEGLGARYEFVAEKQTEDRLRSWNAWDSTAANPYEGHELFIHDDDMDKVGTRITELLEAESMDEGS